VWTLPICLHRFVFHYPAQGRVGKYLVFMFHGIHHAAPRKDALVMPPQVASSDGSAAIFRLAVPPWI
jgi:hypothetical protein